MLRRRRCQYWLFLGRRTYHSALPLWAQDAVADALERARTVNLERHAKLPSFIVDERPCATCLITIEFDRREDWNNKPALEYRFRTPPDACFVSYTVSGSFGRTKQYNPARTGRFLVDASDGKLLQFETQDGEFPKGFGVDPMKSTITWDYINVGTATYVLPVRWEMFTGSTSETFGT
jgi:hypothetical protein